MVIPDLVTIKEDSGQEESVIMDDAEHELPVFQNRTEPSKTIEPKKVQNLDFPVMHQPGSRRTLRQSQSKRIEEMDDPFADLISDLGSDSKKEAQSTGSDNKSGELITDLDTVNTLTKSSESRPS